MLEVLNVCVGTLGGKGIPSTLANMIYYIYTAIKVVIPVMLVIFGSIDLGKAIASQKDDEIKKAQSGFIKKLILAILVFLVFTIVQFVVGFAGEDTDKDNSSEGTSAWGCVDSLLNHKH